MRTVNRVFLHDTTRVRPGPGRFSLFYQGLGVLSSNDPPAGSTSTLSTSTADPTGDPEVRPRPQRPETLDPLGTTVRRTILVRRPPKTQTNLTTPHP